MNVEDFWKPWETTITTFSEIQDLIVKIHDRWPKRSFAWRGVVDASWSLHSALYRRLSWTLNPAVPEESTLYKEESSILADVHRWGLHYSGNSRLSVLNQLAMLQHYGAPTRLIDVTFNPWIGLWFAAEMKWSNGKEDFGNTDGRLFAIDVTDRLINESEERREWEDSNRRPWPDPSDTGDKVIQKRRGWQTTVYAWKPPHVDPRIAAQNGGFILGGVPSTKTPAGTIYWPKDASAKAKRWTIEEVRQATSVALRAHLIAPVAGPGVTENAVYTIRIAASAKIEIRDRLERLFGYQHSTLYRDPTGFSQFGTPRLKTSSNP